MKCSIIYQTCVAVSLVAGLFASQRESSVKVLESFSEYHSEMKISPQRQEMRLLILLPKERLEPVLLLHF